MPFNSSLTTEQVLAVFTEEITALGGKVIDTYQKGQRLFTRSVLPLVEEVRPQDKVQCGVALQATTRGIWLHPYLFRLVCANGAIVADGLESRSLSEVVHELEPDQAVVAIRKGVEACCAPEVFTDIMRQVRTFADELTDEAFLMLEYLQPEFGHDHFDLIVEVLDRFEDDADRSRYGFANAITSVARDTPDPDLRWDLEEFGGAVATGKYPRPPKVGGRRAGEPRRRIRSIPLVTQEA
jgi:hypothetical protein